MRTQPQPQHTFRGWNFTFVRASFRFVNFLWNEVKFSSVSSSSGWHKQFSLMTSCAVRRLKQLMNLQTSCKLRIRVMNHWTARCHRLEVGKASDCTESFRSTGRVQIPSIVNSTHVFPRWRRPWSVVDCEFQFRLSRRARGLVGQAKFAFLCTPNYPRHRPGFVFFFATALRRDRKLIFP